MFRIYDFTVEALISIYWEANLYLQRASDVKTYERKATTSLKRDNRR
jgi:hypothetical protein